MSRDYIVQKPVELDKVKKALRPSLEDLEDTAVWKLEPKYDGVAAVLTIYNDGYGELHTRTGELIRSCRHILQYIARHGAVPGVYFGELWHPTLTQQSISGAVRSHQDGAGHGLQLVLFDTVTEAEHIRGDSIRPYRQRIKRIDMLKAQPGCDLPVVRAADVTVNRLFDGTGVAELATSLKASGGFDGVVAHKLDGLWKRGQATEGQVIKVKPTVTQDVRVTSLEEGKGKFAGMVGAMWVQFADGRRQKCGGGALTTAERQEAWLRPELLAGRVIEMEGMDWTEDRLLREPRFVRVRHDKVDID